MALSLTEIHALAEDLRERITNLWVQRVRDVEGERGAIVLRGRMPGRNRNLLISVHPPATRIHLVDPLPASPSEPSTFVMLCRKHLEGSTLEEIEALPGDRIIRLLLRRSGLELQLVAELTGARAAIHLLDAEGHVLGGLPTAGRGGLPAPVGSRWLPPSSDGLHPGTLRDGWPGPGEALHAFIAETERNLGEGQTHNGQADALQTGLRREIRKLRRRKKAIEGDLSRIEGAAALRHEADLLQTIRSRVKRGAAEVRVMDWQQGAERTLSLHPARSIGEEIERRYHEARRLERGHGIAQRRLDATAERLRKMEHVLARLASTSTERSPEEESELRIQVERLLGEGRPPARPSARTPSRTARRLAWHTFRSRDGFEILVGRGAADNDRLTFQTARGSDIWMHADDWSGAHVIIRRGRSDEIPPGTMEDAALLAAWFSGGRNDTVVSVRWTERKHVRKAKGLAPGQVYLADTRALDVRPAESRRLQELLAQGRPS